MENTEEIYQDIMSAIQTSIAEILDRVKHCSNDNCKTLFLSDADRHSYCSSKCRNNQTMRTYRHNKTKGD